MTFPILQLSDSFDDNVISPAWAFTSVISGSATVAESTGLAIITLPSSTAGTHEARYSTVAAYDLTGGECTISINTMVATGVAATAYWRMFVGAANYIQWTQTSGTLKAQKIVAGVTTDLYSVAWSATTYKYLRIRESGGTVYFDSSTSASAGAAWTNRGSTTIASAFAVTALYVNFGASCGNVAAPGSFRLDFFNLPLPVPSATWRETTADWQIGNRLRSVTLASDGGKQGVLVTADTMDASRVLGGTVRYFAGPMGSTSGGYLQLTEYASLALAQASAFTLPIDGRVDLSAQVDARFMRLYHRSIDSSSHTIYEYMPRRLVQADDIEAETITAINIAAAAITADKIFVVNLEAVSAQMGNLHMDGVIDIDTAGGIYQGSGTFGTPTTGLKLWNSGGVGKLSGYNSGAEQITLDTDGKLKAGGGNTVLDASGVRFQGSNVSGSQLKWNDASAGGDFSKVVGIYATTEDELRLSCDAPDSGHATASKISLMVNNYVASGLASATLYGQYGVLGVSAGLYVGTSIPSSMTAGHAIITGGLNVGTATGTTAGTLSTSGNAGFGGNAAATIRLYSKGVDATSSNYGLYVENSAATLMFYVRNDGTIFMGTSGGGMGFYGSGGATKQTVTGTKTATNGVAVPALTSLLTALANIGLIVNSST